MKVYILSVTGPPGSYISCQHWGHSKPIAATPTFVQCNNNVDVALFSFHRCSPALTLSLKVKFILLSNHLFISLAMCIAL